MDEQTKKRVVMRNGHVSIDPEILPVWMTQNKEKKGTQKFGGHAKQHAKKKK